MNRSHALRQVYALTYEGETMRPAPRKISKSEMPTISVAAKAIQKGVVDKPWIRLGDASIGSLIEMFNDGSPVWLTGSSVWLPAVFGMEPDFSGDFDVVFSSREATERFVSGAVAELNRRIPKDHKQFEAVTNKLGGSRINHPDGNGVIDAWFMGENESIAELVAAYPGGAHIRCAYLVSRHHSAGNLFRLIDEKLFGEDDYPYKAVAMDDDDDCSYYGASKRTKKPKVKTYDSIFSAIAKSDPYPGRKPAASLLSGLLSGLRTGR
jgi:hypothetical protein